MTAKVVTGFQGNLFRSNSMKLSTDALGSPYDITQNNWRKGQEIHSTLRRAPTTFSGTFKWGGPKCGVRFSL